MSAETIRFAVEIEDKNGKPIRDTFEKIKIGDYLSQKVTYYGGDIELYEREAKRIMESIEILNKDVKVSIDVTYLNSITNTWSTIKTIRNYS